MTSEIRPLPIIRIACTIWGLCRDDVSSYASGETSWLRHAVLHGFRHSAYSICLAAKHNNLRFFRVRIHVRVRQLTCKYVARKS